MSLDALLGQVRNSGSEVELGGGLNFGGGLQAVYNPATRMIDITATGGPGGGGGHVIEDEGTPVIQRDHMNFVGPGVTVTDVGGKTTVTIPGGTTVTLPASPGDNNKVAIASSGNLSYAFLLNANIDPNALIALSKLATQAPLSVVANATNGTTVPTAVAAGTANRFFGRRGTALVFDQIVLTTDVSGILPAANGGAVPFTAGTLTGGNQTVHIGTAQDWSMAAGLTSGTATITADPTSGSPQLDETMSFDIFAQGNDVVIQNGGSGYTSSVTVAAGTKRRVYATFTGADYTIRPGGRLA